KFHGLEAGEPLYIEPVPPLHYVVHENDAIHRFRNEFAEVANDKGYNDIMKFIVAEANLRNRLLYASDEGIPHAKLGDRFISTRADRVVTLLTGLLLIEQSEDHQLFVTQCLEALLRIHERIPKNLFDFDTSLPKNVDIFVDKPFGDPPITRVRPR